MVGAKSRFWIRCSKIIQTFQMVTAPAMTDYSILGPSHRNKISMTSKMT
jgi:hypothetical protein